MHNFFYFIYQLASKNKKIAISIALLFLFICGFLATRIKFDDDITRIIPKNEQANITSKVMKQLNFSDKVTVLIEKGSKGNLDDATNLAKKVYDTLIQNQDYIKSIQGYVDIELMDNTYDFINQNLPLFLNDQDYLAIEKKLVKDSIFNQVSENFSTLTSPTGFVSGKYIQNDPLGLNWIGLKKLQEQSIGEGFIVQNGFITSADSSKILLFINLNFENSDTEKTAKFSNYLYGIQHKLNTEFNQKSSIGYFGASLVANANAKQIKSDIMSTIIVSMFTLMLLLVIFYKKWTIPFILFIPTIFSGALAIAFLSIIKPTISAISLSISAVLIGITIDYALHILTHYKKHTNVKALYKAIAKPLIMSATTNAVAFLCLLFVHSEALIDLGIFASIAIFSSAIFSLLLIPHIYKPNNELKPNSFLDKISSYPFENNKILIAICLLVICVSFFTFNNVGYNNDLSKLNFVPKDLKLIESKLDSLTHNHAKSVYVVSYGNSLDEAIEKYNITEKKLHNAKNDSIILSYSKIQNAIQAIPAQREAFDKWNKFWESKKPHVKENLINAGLLFGFKESTHDDFFNRFKLQPSKLTIEDYNQIDALATNDFISEKDNFYTISSLVKLNDVKRTIFLNEFNNLPNVVNVDRKQLNETYLGQLKNDFNSLINYTFVSIIFILWIFFKRIEWVILSMIPIVLTGFVTAGLMGFLGIEFNIFSAIVCTLVFGHGVDFSIFMTSALQKQYTTGKNELQTYRTSILLAVLTTVLAIGALIFAKHPALLSIASVSLIGVFSAVIITFVFYPVLFKFFVINRVKKGLSPVNFRLLLLSVLFFIYYGISSLITSLVGRLVLNFSPLSKKYRQDIFSNFMAFYMKTVLNLNPYVKLKFSNPYNEQFKKPAIIISNHTSFLDTLTIGMRVPKIIFIVNDWVWNSPIFGRIVRAAGFFPISAGIDGGTTKLKEKIKMGYSVMIFPEGTRSYDNTVKRFHKGAFYLAEQLNLDIIPFYIHGNSEVLPKGDYIVFDGKISTKIGKRFINLDLTLGETYSARAKSVSKIFKKEYQNFRIENESVDYFKNKLIWSFLYKDEEIITNIKKDFEANKTVYYNLNQYFSNNEMFTHLADNFGQLDFILALQQTNRKIDCFISNEENRAVAKSNYLNVHRNINFTSQLNVSNSKLLISAIIDESFNLNIFENFSEIIMVKNELIISKIEKLGFKIISQTKEITCFVKN